MDGKIVQLALSVLYKQNIVNNAILIKIAARRSAAK